jgi:acyl transferase domain-containing protein/NAD(P)-dependent dehydrogenase (short-subunit alcohol dehydrogenase family)
MNAPELRPSGANSEPIAVIGIGCLFPGSDDRNSYWANIRDGRDLIEDVPDGYWNPQDYHDLDPDSPDRTYGRRGGFLTPVPFRPLQFGITPRDLEATDTSQLLSLVAAHQALLDAGYDPQRTFNRSRAAVILGVTGALELVVPLGARLGHPHWWRALRAAGVDESTASKVVQNISDSYVSWQENSFPGLLGNVVAGRIANRLDLHGTNCVTDAACASSLAAIHLSMLELRSGRSDLVISGGVDTFNDIFMYMCFSKTPALSPSGDARPFDSQADGTVLGEGIGLVVLKRLSDAVRDGDRIYARILSIGTSSDGKGAAIYAPTAAGQQRCLQDAYQQAGVAPCSIGLVEAHGTGTAVGDATELQALQEIYSRAGSQPSRCALGSVKSQIGHTKAASGAAGLIKAVLSLHHKVQPPSIKIREPLQGLQDESTPFHIESSARPWIRRPDSPRRAAVSSFGFGGSNFHAVLEENSPGRIETDWQQMARLFAFSASSTDRLQHQLEQARAAIEGKVSQLELDCIARDTRTRFHHHDEHRLTITQNLGDSLETLLDEALSTLTQEQQQHWNLPVGIDRDGGPPRGSLAIIFPGQGSQKVDMLRAVCCRFPEMVQVVDDAESVFWNEQGQAGLASRIWPPRSFNRDQVAQEEALRRTDVAQPAIGAVSLGLYRTLTQFGIQGEMFGGHSFGELTALAASGRLGDIDFHQLANFRGRLMARAGGIDAGSMLAVALPIAELERFVEENCPRLVIANRNAPQQAVLSGPQTAIADAMGILDQRGIRNQKLPVAAAFHSAEVASAAEPFKEILQKARFHASNVPVLANSTGREYPQEEDAARDLLAHQIARPVLFLDMIEEMVRLGATTFLEVGPGQVLTGLMRNILSDISPQSVAIATDGGKEDSADLARAIARVAVRGHRVDLCRWDPRSVEAPDTDDSLVVMIRGSNFRPGEVTAKPVSAAVPAPSPRVVADHPVGDLSGQAAIPSAVLHDSQESLMQALEGALEAQQRLSEAQQTAEGLLEKSLGASVGEVPSIVMPAASAAQVPDVIPPAEPVAVSPITIEAAATPAAGQFPPAVQIRATIVKVVAEKTGYPESAVATDLDLEADLGIDSIKRVEILSALRERAPQLPAIPPELLGTLRSIDAIADWYQEQQPTPQPATARQPTSTPTATELSTPVATPGREKMADSGATSTLTVVIQQVVAEKTGYPQSAIGTDLDLEADLGIDSIKRVEILSALREKRPDLAAIPPEMLGTLRTILSIVEWYANTPTQEAPEQDSAVVETTAAVQAPILDIDPTPEPIASPREHEQEPLKLLEAIPVAVSRRRVARTSHFIPGGGLPFWVVCNDLHLSEILIGQLRSAGIDAQPRRLEAAQETPEQDSDVGGMLVVIDTPPDPDSAILNSFRWLRRVGRALQKETAGSDPLVVLVQRFDGQFGLDADRSSNTDPTGSALAGLAKCAAREWPEITVRTIDLSPDFHSATDAAKELIEELLDGEDVEVGLAPSQRIVLELRPEGRISDNPPLLHQPRAMNGGLVVVTGGARGITAACVDELAAKYRPSLLLLGRTPEPESQPDWSRELPDDRLEEHLFDNNAEDSTPAQIRERAQSIRNSREIAARISSLEALGAKVLYRCVDVRDRDALEKAIDEARAVDGPVRGIIHGAGVLADSWITEKSDEQFQLVWSTKVDPARHLLSICRDEELDFISFFSSVTARLGRKGQSDYAAANETLNRIAQIERTLRPDCRIRSIGWGPWDGGMVQDGLRTIFHQEGIDLIPLDLGARLFLETMETEGSPQCLIVATLDSPEDALERLCQFPDGQKLVQTQSPRQPQMEKGDHSLERGATVVISIDRMAPLRHHVLGSRAVVPAALLLEWCATAAVHRHPGLDLHGIDNFRILKGVVLENPTEQEVVFFTGAPQSQGELLQIPVEIRSVTFPDQIHARAEVLLGTRSSARSNLIAPIYSDEDDPGYGKALFHGATFQCIETISEISVDSISFRSHGADAPEHWFREPLRHDWLIDPLRIDAPFQALILWSRAQHQSPCLPCGIDRLRCHQKLDSGLLETRVHIDGTEGSIARARVEILNRSGIPAITIEGAEVLIDASLESAFRGDRLPEEASH